MKTNKQLIGKIGEDLACEHLKNEQHKIKERNYLRKWGEIDIISEKSGKIYFTEVKTVTRIYTSYSSKAIDNYKAEDNIHLYKANRLKRTIQTYLLGIKRGIEWQFDVIVIILNKEDLEPVKLDHWENVIL